MKKRLLQIFFLCLPLAVLLTVSAGAAKDSGTWGDNVTWKLSDGVLTVSGQGEMAPTSPNYPGWLGRSADIKSIVIQNGITSISNHIFESLKNVTTVKIPDSVTQIGEGAFNGCAALLEITIPGSVETIGSFAFAHCSSLQKATIQEGVKTIGVGIFDSCSSLVKISVPGSVLSIQERLGSIPVEIATLPVSAFNPYPPFPAKYLKEVIIIGNADIIPAASFSACETLEKVTILDGVTAIDERAFYECKKLTDVYLPSSLTTIGMHAFGGCSQLTNCVIPDSVTSIQQNAFSYCTSLRKVIIPRGLTVIEMSTFNQTRLEELYIPLSVTKIEQYAFGDSRDAKTDQVRGQLKDVYYEGSEAQWKQMNIDNTNYLLSDATIHYNSTMPPITLPVPATTPAESPAPPVENNTPAFEDVPDGAYYADAVQWAVENGVTNGLSETVFAPNETCNRGQVATFLWRAKGCPEPVTTDNPFTDVAPSSAFYKAILWAAENGITAGTSDTTFSPANPCTRAHVVTFLWRAQGKPAAAGDSPLADSFPPGYYTDAVRWADAAGLLGGTGEAFAPSTHCPRADIVTYLYRVLT